MGAPFNAQHAATQKQNLLAAATKTKRDKKKYSLTSAISSVAGQYFLEQISKPINHSLLGSGLSAQNKETLDDFIAKAKKEKDFLNGGLDNEDMRSFVEGARRAAENTSPSNHVSFDLVSNFLGQDAMEAHSILNEIQKHHPVTTDPTFKTLTASAVSFLHR